MNRQERWEETNDLFQWIKTNQNLNGFVGDIYDQICKDKPLSPRQIEGVKRTMTYIEKKVKQDKLRESNKDILPGGAYVGTEKKRYDMTLKYMGNYETRRGFTVHNFMNKEGAQLMCFSDMTQIRVPFIKNDELHILSEGDVFTCRATINRHSINDFDPNNKFKQTVLNRIKYKQYLGNKQHLEEGNL